MYFFFVFLNYIMKNKKNKTKKLKKKGGSFKSHSKPIPINNLENGNYIIYKPNNGSITKFPVKLLITPENTYDLYIKKGTLQLVINEKNTSTKKILSNRMITSNNNSILKIPTHIVNNITKLSSNYLSEWDKNFCLNEDNSINFESNFKLPWRKSGLTYTNRFGSLKNRIPKGNEYIKIINKNNEKENWFITKIETD